MARPIKPTPILKGREAAKFTSKIEAERSTPSYCKASPDVNAIKEAARALAGRTKKHV